jgi:hypothetical protein
MNELQAWDYNASVEKVKRLIDQGAKEAVSNHMRSTSTTTPSVYFIQSGYSGPVKIGVASSPKKRLAQLQTGNPEKLVIVKVIKGKGIDYERELHRIFADYHIRDEWFRSEVIGLIADV